MGLSKIRIGDVISQVDERNSFGITDFYGINIFKEFMPTVANTENLDNSKYKIVRKNRFVYSGMQTGRDKCIRISMFMKDSPVIVSPAYTTFEVDQEKILPEYFFMLFLSKEKDRLGWFHSDGSVRANLDWDVFCDLEFEIPDVPTQQKYVDIYDAMCANQKAYEKGLDDLKLTCDAYIEELRRKMPCEKIGDYISFFNEKNIDESITLEQGVNIKKEFITPQRGNSSLASRKIVKTGHIVYCTQLNNENVAVALRDGPNCVVSPVYDVVEISRPQIMLGEYLLLWMQRPEFGRYVYWASTGTSYEFLSPENLQNYKIPVPSINVQKSIANIHKVFVERKRINEKLKQQIKNISPILIKGAIEEGKSKRG